ncbi:MAG TPA: phosphatidate cytidylyltransferase [Burkholderiales bacterium]|nr:phosphatidate cytidylyltransferase [Burkholderiales bacterium]
MSRTGIPGSAAAAEHPRSALRQRVLTAAVLLPVLLAGMFLLSGLGWQLLLCLPVLLGALEWSRLAGYRAVARNLFTAMLLASCLAFVVLLQTVPQLAIVSALSLLMLVAALLFWAVAAPLWLFRGWRPGSRWLMGAVGWVVLVPAWLGAVCLQRQPWLLLAVMCAIWIADTAAYFAGRRFGRRRLAPQISPGKTWEGVIGAFAAVLLYVTALSFLLQPSTGAYERIVLLIFAAALTVLGIVGDLFESWVKRSAGVKDSGSLLPGHGGVLDRIDSLTATLPFAALYLLPVLGTS